MTDFDGVTQLADVALIHVTLVHVVPPMVMVGAAVWRKPVPVRVMVVPPDVTPVVGLTEVTVGAGLARVVAVLSVMFASCTDEPSVARTR